MLTADTRLQVRHRELYHQDTASSISINIFGSVFFGLRTHGGDVNGPSGCPLNTAVCWTWEHPFLTMGRSRLSLCSRGRYSLCLPRLFTIQVSMTVYPQKRTVNASLTSHVETQEVRGETCPNRQLTWSVVKHRCVRPAVHGVLTWVCHNHNLCHKSGICRYYYQHRVWKTIVCNNFLLVLKDLDIIFCRCKMKKRLKKTDGKVSLAYYQLTTFASVKEAFGGKLWGL